MGRFLSTLGAGLATFAATISVLAAGASPAVPLLVIAPEGPADAPAVEADDTEQGEDALGLTLGVGVASAYVFRGSNLLQARSQHDPHAVVQPSVAYDIPSTDLTLSYFASYQFVGANRAERVAEGTGDEQDLSLAWARSIGAFEVGTSLGAYVYPFADTEAAGTRVPTYLEPGASVSASTAVDLRLDASLMAGLQDAIRPSTYLYLHPSLGRSVELSEGAELEVAAGYGLKLQRASDNTHDVSLDMAVTLSPTARVDVTPAAHWAWTNLAERSFAEEQVVWASIEMGARL